MSAQFESKNSFLLSEATESFITNLKVENKSLRTAYWYEEIFGVFKTYCRELNVIELRQIDSDLIKRFLLYLKEEKLNPNSKRRGLAQSTIAGYFRGLHAFFNYLVREEWLADSPMRTMRGVKRPKEKVEPFEPEEFQKLLNVIPKKSFLGLRDYTLLWLLYDTGIRIGEALDLCDSDVNVMQMFMKVRGKGGKERVVPFGITTRKVLHRYMDRWKRQEKLTEKLFISRYGIPIGYRQVQRAMARYGKKAKINRVRCSPHTLRHSFAIQYLMNGGDQFSLQDILGHEDPSTTAIYVNLSIELNQAVRAPPRRN